MSGVTDQSTRLMASRVVKRILHPTGWPAILALISALFVYLRVSHRHIDTLTGALFLLSISFWLVWVGEVICAFLVVKRATLVNIRTLLVTLCLGLFTIEGGLRFGLKRYASYSEQTEQGGYQSLYWVELPRRLWVHSPGPYSVSRPEFEHHMVANSNGLIEREIEDKAPDEFRIVALGDSYTEGMGTTFDSSYVRLLDDSLHTRFPNQRLSVINAGVAGSDPFYEYMLLKQGLSLFDPDLAIVAINFSDIYDLQIRGGMGRFDPSGRVPAGPRWEWLYGSSFIVRAFVHDVLDYNYRFIRGRDLDASNRRIGGLLTEAVDSIAKLAADHDFRLLVVTHPNRYEIWRGELEPALVLMERNLRERTDIDYFNALDYFKANGPVNGDNVSDYIWPVDGHYRGMGYGAMANAIANEILRRGYLTPPSEGDVVD